MESEIQKYLDNVQNFLNLDIDNPQELTYAVERVETANRVIIDKSTHEFQLGMAKWSFERIRDALHQIRSAIIASLDAVVVTGKIGEEELNSLNQTSHDLKIQHIFDSKNPNGMKLGYVVPDSKIAWEEGKCPHCGETVTIHLFPDPIPILGYEAIINTLRLLTRNAPIKKRTNGEYYIAV